MADRGRDDRAWSGRRIDVPLLLAWVIALAFAVGFCILSVARHAAFESHAFDLGNAEQAVWNTLHGAPFRFTNQATPADPITTRLAIHVEPILLLVAGLFLLHSGPETLLTMQAVAVGLGAVPAYLLARAALGRAWLALAFPVVYVLHPSLQAAVLDDFHAVVLAAPLLMLALYAGLYGSMRVFTVAAVLAMATKEEIGLMVTALALLVLLMRRRRAAIPVAVIGLLWTVIAMGVIIPHFNPAGHSPYLNRYHELGASLPSIAANVFRHPLHTWHVVTDSARLHYLGFLLRPTGFIALLGPLVLLVGLPELFINLLSTKPAMYSGFYQYSAVLVPVLVAAAPIGIADIQAAIRAVPNSVGANCLRLRFRHQLTKPAIASVRPRAWSQTRACSAVPGQDAAPLRQKRSRQVGTLLTVLLLGLAGWQQYREGFSPLAAGFSIPWPGPHQRLEARLLKRIPSSAAVSAADEINPHLANRRTLYLFPATHVRGLSAASYAVMDASVPSAPIEPHTVARAARVLLHHGWHVVAGRQGILILARGPGEHTLPPAFYSFIYRSPRDATKRLRRQFGPLTLLGYSLHPGSSSVSWVRPTVSVDSYWRLERAARAQPHIAYLVSPVYTGAAAARPAAAGGWHAVSDSPTTAWRPVSAWPLHRTVFVQQLGRAVNTRLRGRVDIRLVAYLGSSPFVHWLGPPVDCGTVTSIG